MPARPGGCPRPECLAIVRNLIGHDEDADDIHLPLLVWWAIEAKADSDRDAVIGLFREREFWSRPIVRGTIAERVMRRYASSGSRKDLLTCAELLRLAPEADDAKRLMTGFEAALSGRSLPSMPDELAEALARFEKGSVTLGLRRGRPEAIDEALRVLPTTRRIKGFAAPLCPGPRRGLPAEGRPRAPETGQPIVRRIAPGRRPRCPPTV